MATVTHMVPFLLLIALVVAVAAVGAILRARSGRTVRVVPGVEDPELAIGDSGTLVQFSSALCVACPPTARLLAEVAADRPTVAHLEVDIEQRPDLTARFGILRTPTTLLVDGSGRVRGRISGAPRRHELVAELDRLLPAGPISAAAR